MNNMEVLLQNFQYITVPMVIMWAIGGVLIYLAIVKEMEPTLLLPMGFGAILVNLPVAVEGTGVQHVLDAGSGKSRQRQRAWNCCYPDLSARELCSSYFGSPGL